MSADRTALTAFTEALADGLHADKKILSADPSRTDDRPRYNQWKVTQNRAAIGRHAGWVRVRTCDYHWTDPAGYTPSRSTCRGASSATRGSAPVAESRPGPRGAVA
jgi:spore germination protein YaaH